MKIKAAVAQGKGKDLLIKEVELAQPNKDEVLVEIVASGICHTDLVARDFESPAPPAIFGHEGGGIVKEVGEDVDYVKPGDHVVLCCLSCGKCDMCLTGHPGKCEQHMALNFSGNALDGKKRHSINGEDVGMFFGQSSFATHAVVNVQNVVKVPTDVDLTVVAPFGCGIQTGAGTVLNGFKPKQGSTIAILGMGGVGLSAAMAAKIAGCSEIIAVDIKDSRLKMAEEVGATATINSKNIDTLYDQIREIVEDGPDYVLDTTGVTPLIEKAIDAMKHGGTIAVVGARFNFTVTNSLMEQGKTIIAFTQGDSIPKLFIPQLIKFYQEGRFPVDKFITKFDFNDINDALAASESGEAIKPVLVM